MCGIFGYVTTKPSNKFAHILAQGLHADTVRGSCGTGIYAYGLKDKNQDVYKRALAGPDFVNTSQFEKFLANSSDYNVVIGHNRAATHGSAKDGNCHPFVFGDIGLVHNGTLRAYHRLVKEHKFSHQVDSAYAAKGMADHGEQATLEQTEGPFVFVWHNKSANTFNIARNNNRDIWWILDKDATTLWFASEYLMLHWILDRNDVDTGGRKYRGLNEHQWLSWDMAKGLKIPKAIQFEEYKAPVYSGHNYGHFNGNSAWKSRDEKILAEWGLEMYQTIEVKIDKFSPYQHGTFGTIEGFAVGPEGSKYNNLPVTIHSADAKFYDLIKDDGRCLANVTYVGIQRDSKAGETYLSASYPKKYTAEGVTKPKEQVQSKSPQLTETFQGPPGTFRSKEDMLEAISGGCCYCGDPIRFEDLGKLSWIEWTASETYPVCPSCTDNPSSLKDLNSYGRLLRFNG